MVSGARLEGGAVGPELAPEEMSLLGEGKGAWAVLNSLLLLLLNLDKVLTN